MFFLSPEAQFWLASSSVLCESTSSDSLAATGEQASVSTEKKY